MTDFLTVRSLGALDLDHAATIASLPASLRLIPAGQADIVVATPDLASIVAGIAASPRALVVTRPAMVDDASASALAAAAMPVFPALLLAPRLRLIDAGATAATAGFIRSRLSWHGPLRETLLEHLTGLHAALGPLSDIRILAMAADGHVGTARTEGGVAVSWSGQTGAARPDYELDIVGLADRLDVSGELDGSARPLLVRHATADGLRQPHGIFETGLRCFWRAVVADIVGGKTALRWSELAGLHALARDLAAPAPMRRGDAA